MDAMPGKPSSRPRCTVSGPILLTAAAAILGMIPIAPTIFRGPMAHAIMGGLAVATVLTLVFLPALERHAPEATCRSIPLPS